MYCDIGHVAQILSIRHCSSQNQQIILFKVTTVLESLEHEYSRDEDWYEKSKAEYDPEQYLQAQLQVHNQKKQSFLKACNWARRTGETFQKYSLRNIYDAKLNTNALREIEVNTKSNQTDSPTHLLSIKFNN